MFKITHKIALLIIVPLVIELCFLGVVMSSLEDMEKDRQDESRAVESMVYVNLILNDTWTASTQMVLFKTTRSENFMTEMQELYESLNARKEKLIEINDLAGEPDPETAHFIHIIEEITEVFKNTGDILDESAEYTNISLMSKVSGLVKELNKSGLTVIEKQSDARRRFHEKQTLNRQKLKSIVESAAIANVILAVFLALIFSLTFARRFNVLMNNTMNIAIGKPLGKPISGTDELAKLDGVIHNLSTELEATREKERAMIDNTAVIICSLNESLRISEVNPAIEPKLGYEISELLGTNLLDDTTIAMTGGLLMFVTPIDWKDSTFILDWTDMKNLPWGILLLFGGGLSLAQGMEDAGLVQLIGDQISQQGNLSTGGLIVTLSALSMFLTELMSNVALTTILVPVVLGIADGLQISPIILAMPVAFAASCAFMMPISTPPNAILFASGYISVKQMMKAGVLVNLSALILISIAMLTLGLWLYA